MTNPLSTPLSARNWFGKASAGFVLGLVIAVGLSGLVGWSLGLKDTFVSLPGQFTMWIISPLWCAILSFVFLFRSGPRAWGVLGLAAAAIWLALFALGGLT